MTSRAESQSAPPRFVSRLARSGHWGANVRPLIRSVTNSTRDGRILYKACTYKNLAVDGNLLGLDTASQCQDKLCLLDFCFWNKNAFPTLCLRQNLGCSAVVGCHLTKLYITLSLDLSSCIWKRKKLRLAHTYNTITDLRSFASEIFNFQVDNIVQK